MSGTTLLHSIKVDLYGPDAPGTAARLANDLNALDTGFRAKAVRLFSDANGSTEYAMRTQRTAEDAAFVPDSVAITDRPWRTLCGNLAQDADMSRSELICSVDAAATRTRYGMTISFWIGDPSAEASGLTRKDLEDLGIKTTLLDMADPCSAALVVAGILADVSNQAREREANAMAGFTAGIIIGIGILCLLYMAIEWGLKYMPGPTAVLVGILAVLCLGSPLVIAICDGHGA